MQITPFLRACALAVTLMALPAGAGFAQTAAPAAPAPAPAATAADAEAQPAGTYTFDEHHSHIVFGYSHLGFSTSTGLIRGVSGAITLDPTDPAKSSVEASFPMSAMMTVSPDLDKDMYGDDLFKGVTPQAEVTFKSTEVAPSGDTTAKVTGDLTLNGVTKPVTLDVTLVKAGEHPMRKVPAFGFEAMATIRRSDFNLGAFAPAVSDAVDVQIHVEAQKG